MNTDREHSAQQKQSRLGFRGMTVRDWLDLLIVPLVLIIIGFLFTAQQDQRQQAIEEQRAEKQQELEEQRAQDLTLQSYLDQMSTLVLEDLGDPKVQTLARARTLTVLRRLDPSRKEEVMQFLLEADLINSVGESDPVIELNGANLSATDLSDANLSNADLHGANLTEVDLRIADLSDTDLSDANLSDANLSDANLYGANLTSADLRDANLNDADLYSANLTEADLHGADLSDAGLSDADLTSADLSDANLSNADLYGANLRLADLSNVNLRRADLREANLLGAAGITDEMLEQQAYSLRRATMPNGVKHGY
jgi:uncharacterized protein YjbI with pentapeptide repeats